MNNFHCSRYCAPKGGRSAPSPAAEQEQREERSSNATVAIPASRLQQHFPDDQIRDQMVAQAAANLNMLMRNPARDKTLTDWMVKNYKNIPGI